MLIPGIVFLFFGAVSLFILVYEWKQDCRLFRTGTRTMARITDRITYPDDDNLQSSQWKLIGEFRDRDGRIHHAKSRRHVCGSESRELMGTEMEVVYLEDDPVTARFALDEEKHIGYWAVSAFSLVAIMGILLVLGSIINDAPA
jgi:hypothetical protein